MIPTTAYAALTGLFVGATVKYGVDAYLERKFELSRHNVINVKKYEPFNSQPKNSWIIPFYLDEWHTEENDYIHDIIGWGPQNANWESKHKFIQWIFPTPFPSQYNSTAPLLTKDTVHLLLQNNDTLVRYAKCFAHFMTFMSIAIIVKKDDDSVELKASPELLKKPVHNFKRLTRVLTSLRCFGFDDVAFKLYNTLIDLNPDQNLDSFNDSKRFWVKVVQTADIWEMDRDTNSAIDNAQFKSLEGVESSLLSQKLKEIQLSTSESHTSTSPREGYSAQPSMRQRIMSVWGNLWS